MSTSTAGIAGVVHTQVLPFLLPQTVRLAEDFEAALSASL